MANWKVVAGILLIAVGLVLTIVSMATLSWIECTFADGGTQRFGLVQQQSCNDRGTCTTEKIDCGTAGPACEGGKQAIASSVASLVCAVAGFIFTFFAYRKGKNLFRFLAIASWFAAGALAILSVVLYSKKTELNLDYSYIIYLFCSFISLIGATVVLYGPGVSQLQNTQRSTAVTASSRDDCALTHRACVVLLFLAHSRAAQLKRCISQHALACHLSSPKLRCLIFGSESQSASRRFSLYTFEQHAPFFFFLLLFNLSRNRMNSSLLRSHACARTAGMHAHPSRAGNVCLKMHHDMSSL